MRKLAWAIWAVTMALIPVQVTLLIVGRHTKAIGGFGFPGFASILPSVIGSIGVVLATRRSRNAIGWIFLGDGLLFAAQGAGYAYAKYGLLGPHTHWPAAVYGAWMNAWFWIPAVVTLATVVLLVFPDGALPSPRWRWTIWWIVLALPVACTFMAFASGPLDNFPLAKNPLGVHSSTLNRAGSIAFASLNVMIVVAAASLVVRYRRAGATEREQIKWLAYAGLINAIVLPIGDFFGAKYKTVDVLIILSILFIPIAIGIAVMRYRLYDIDRIISRTVSYAIVSALLAGIFILIVLAPTALIGSSSHTPSWLVATATLVVALSFQRVRRRVQSGVDHRFNRARYDASRIIDAFAVRLRDEVDLRSLESELAAVVVRTMQPSQVGVWLAPSRRS
jgi:hypothetical protein